MGTLKTLITSDVSTVFHNTDDFADTVTFYPKGESHNASSITAVVISDNEEGSREAHGDGIVLDRDDGEAVRRSVKLEILASVAVQDPQDSMRPDKIKLADGTVLAVQRIIGRDDDMMTILCVRRDDVTTKFPVRSG